MHRYGGLNGCGAVMRRQKRQTHRLKARKGNDTSTLGGIEGKASEIEISVNEIRKIKDELVYYYSANIPAKARKKWLSTVTAIIGCAHRRLKIMV